MVVSRILIDSIKKEAVEYLGLKDYFQLKDRFEGELFLSKTLKKSIGIHLFEKRIGEKINFSSSFIESEPVLTFKNTNFSICTYFREEKILIPNHKCDIFVIYLVSKDFINGRFVGWISYEDVINKNTENNNEGLIQSICELDLSDLNKEFKW
jgi:hypothetical protein